MSIIKEWVNSLFILILILSFTEILLPEGTISKYIRFFFSLMIVAVIIYPIINIIKAY